MRVVLVAVGVIAIPLAFGSGPRLGGVVSALTGLALSLTWGMRFRLRVDGDGVHYTSFVLGFVPAWRAHYLLDAEVYRCGDGDWGDDDGLTLAVRDRVQRAGDREAIFGPVRDPALGALSRRIDDAIAEFRAQVPRESLLRLRHPWLPQAPRPLERHQSGRIVRWMNLEPLTIGTTRIPTGSSFALNPLATYGWIDPRCDDDLDEVTLAASTRIIDRGLVARAGASIRFGDGGEVIAMRNAAQGPIEAEYRGCPLVFDGTASLRWDERGDIAGGTLALEAHVGALRIPAGSELSSFTLGRVFELNGPMSLPQLELSAGARLHYTRNRLHGVGLPDARTVKLNGRRWRLRGAGAVIPLHADGRINLRAGPRLGNITACEGTR